MGIMEPLAGFIDNDGLAEAFAVKPDDPGKVRKPLLDGIKRAREQFADRASGPVRGANRWWQLQNGIVAFTMKLGGGVLELNGAETNHIPEPMFEQFLNKFEQAVSAGELDSALKAKQADRAKPSVPIYPGVQARPISERHPSNDREDWDSLTWAQRQKVSAMYRQGKNPDRGVISEDGYRPDAPLS